MNYDNRRQFHRINLDGTVNIKFTDDSYDYCQVRNLSLTGMYVLGNFKRRMLDDCLVKLFHDENSGINCMQAVGKVVWSDAEGAGLQFTTMTFENYMLLQTTLIKKAEQPEIILREFPRNAPFEIAVM